MLPKVKLSFVGFAGQVPLHGGRTDEGYTDDIRTALNEVEEFEGCYIDY